MITVDSVKEKLQNEGADTLANNEQLLKTGSVKKQNGNSVFYWLLGLGALGLGAYLFFHKKGGAVTSGENTGISG
jgi:hypothetical protein